MGPGSVHKNGGLAHAGRAVAPAVPFQRLVGRPMSSLWFVVEDERVPKIIVSPLPRFVLLFAALYAAFGVSSPFLPAFVNSRGLPAEQLGLVLGVGTAVRLLAGPWVGRLGDMLQALRAVLVVVLVLGAVVTLGYLEARGFWALLGLTLIYSTTLAPVTILADALALGSASPPKDCGRRGFEYGWVRGAGSAAFVAGTLVTGHAVAGLGLGAIIVLESALLAMAVPAAIGVPEVVHRRPERESPAPAGAFRTLLRLACFRNVVLVAALVLGSHAMHDAFAVIRWSRAGIGPGTVSVLWSISVAAEVLVFVIVGPALVRRLTPAGAMALASLAGVLRWTVVAQTSQVVALALMQPLHGITFALLHLSCMHVIARVVPRGLEGTAQAVYGILGVGGATALLTVASGSLYGRLGAHGFWVMAALCAVATPFTLRLRQTEPDMTPD